MKLIYTEIYGADEKTSISIPTLKVILANKNDNSLPNLKKKKIQEDDGFYFVNLSFDEGLFDCFSEIVKYKLQSLLSFYNKLFGYEYINRDIWKPFLFTSNVKLLPIKKTINSNITNSNNSNKFVKDSRQIQVEQYYHNKNLPFDNNIASLQFELYNKMKNELITNNIYNTDKLRLRYKIRVPNNNYLDVIDIMSAGYWGGAISISYEIDFTNELDLLYTFLDCLFSSEYNYKIKQCNKCDKFFITLKSDHLHCPTCLRIHTKERKQKHENQNIIKLERKINSLYNSPYTSKEDRQKYLYEKMRKKIEYEDDEEKLKNWYLSHYKNEETKKRNDYIVKK